MTCCFVIVRYLLLVALVSQHFVIGQQVPARKIHVHRALLFDRARNFTLDNGSDSTYDAQVNYLTEASMLDGLRIHYCYVNVKVFKSSALKYPANNVSVFALVIDPTHSDNNINFTGYTEAQTDINGNACVRTICRKNAIIFVDTGIERLHIAANQLMPSQLSSTSLSATEILLKKIYQIPAFFHPPGPVYTKGFLPECKNPQPLAYYIGFHFLGPPDKFEENTNASKLSYDESWYPLREGESGYKVCYIKVKVQTPFYNVSIKLESYNNQSNFYYGSMTSGPKEDPKAGNILNRAACIEYRCPYEDPSSGKIIATRLEGKLTVPRSVSCRKSNISPDFQSGGFNITNSNFEISLTPHDDYGPNAGIYFNKVRKVAKSLCFTGANDIIDNYEMNPDTGYAFQFTCEANLPSDNLVG
ncbi:uncharacterized protein LOC110452150 [Mizuhopecten yessoensis]|uniref:Cartilage intermediate layer protein 1/2 C-terminal domain-containing protein n=1 Tax=Mizuhopecten yessoensis TaxID=6573 RepID=A0A210QK89_MIZYE|nr:uncharacterized protein LOC110452150 [Mizuhopecten yessoensis]OWF49163.1 hypothetical protein KP79_PYT23958 [Mizuhopecten yessoensis]